MPVATPVFDGAREDEISDVLEAANRNLELKHAERYGKKANEAFVPDGRRVAARPSCYDGRTGEPFREPRHRRPDLHPQAAAPRRRQDPRAFDRPVLAHHPAAARWQGAVRRPALRRDGSLGPVRVRRRLRAAGDPHDQVRRHPRPRQGVRGHRQGREHPRAGHPRVVQGPRQGDAVALPRRRDHLASPARRSSSRKRTKTSSRPPRSSGSTWASRTTEAATSSRWTRWSSCSRATFRHST